MELSWQQVVDRRARPTLIVRLALLFVGWRAIYAPLGMPFEIKRMDGRPVYMYKLFRGRTYYLRPWPAESLRYS